MSNTPRPQNRIHSSKRPSFTLSVATSLALLAIAVLSLVLIGGDTASAGGFNPTATASLSDTTPGANANIVTSFDLKSPDYNFGALIAFTPSEFFVAADADVPDGAGVTFLSALATLGVINGPCTPSGLRPEFQMMDAITTTANGTVTFGDDPDGNPNDGIDNDGDGLIDEDPDDVGEIFEDDNGDTIPNGVQMYPDFLLRTFPGLQPRARLYGQTSVVGNDVSLNFVIFEPGTSFPRTNEPPFETDPALGYPSVTILNNMGDPEADPVPSTITDFCSPLQTVTTTCGLTQVNSQMTRSNPCPSTSGPPVRTNPNSDMTVNTVTFAASQPDADGDGHENGLDTCPYDINVESPRDGGLLGDPDVDGIDSACDPDPAAICGPGLTGSGPDCDGDGFLNRGDNCPLVWNGDDRDTKGVVEGQENADGDGIGDVCDENPNSMDGEPLVLARVTPLDIGAGGTPPYTEADLIATTDVVCLDMNRNGTCDMDEGLPPPTNTAPVCNGVEVTAFADTTTPSFSLNCSDANGDSLTCSVVTDGSKGSVSITNCESATYTPKPGESGTDSFTYKANDNTVDSADAAGNVTILTDADGDGVVDADDQCPGTASGADVDPSGCSDAQLEELKEEKKKELIEEATAGMNLRSSLDTVIAGGSTAVLAACADENDNPIPNLDITFKIDSQPGSDADLEGAAEVTNTSDAKGVAEAELNVGSTAGDIVVSAAAEGCEAKTITIAVKAATEAGGDDDTTVAGEETGPTGGGAGGPDTGVGSLAPIASSIPAWAAIVSALGGAGLLGSLGAIASRVLRRRR